MSTYRTRTKIHDALMLGLNEEGITDYSLSSVDRITAKILEACEVEVDIDGTQGTITVRRGGMAIWKGVSPDRYLHHVNLRSAEEPLADVEPYLGPTHPHERLFDTLPLLDYRMGNPLRPVVPNWYPRRDLSSDHSVGIYTTRVGDWNLRGIRPRPSRWQRWTRWFRKD